MVQTLKLKARKHIKSKGNKFWREQIGYLIKHITDVTSGSAALQVNDSKDNQECRVVGIAANFLSFFKYFSIHLGLVTKQELGNSLLIQ